MEGFEAKHRTGDALYKAVILFKDVVDIFLLPDGEQLAIPFKFEDHIHRLKPRKIGTAFINVYAVRLRGPS